MLPACILALAMQPDPAMLRHLFEEGLTRAERQYGSADARTAQAARDLGLFLARQGDPGAAAALAEAVRIDQKAFGDSAPQTLADTADLAENSASAAAEPLWRRAAGAADPALAARALAALGNERQAAGDRPGAAVLLRRAVAKQEDATGPSSELVARRLNALAGALEPKDALPLLERALAIDRRVLGAHHPESATTEANLAGALVHLRRYDEAVRAAADAMTIFQESLGPEHPRCAITASILGFALEGVGDRIRAEQMFRLAVAIDLVAYGPNHPQTTVDQRALAEFLRGK